MRRLLAHWRWMWLRSVCVAWWRCRVVTARGTAIIHRPRPIVGLRWHGLLWWMAIHRAYRSRRVIVAGCWSFTRRGRWHRRHSTGCRRWGDASLMMGRGRHVIVSGRREGRCIAESPLAHMRLRHVRAFLACPCLFLQSAHALSSFRECSTAATETQHRRAFDGWLPCRRWHGVRRGRGGKTPCYLDLPAVLGIDNEARAVDVIPKTVRRSGGDDEDERVMAQGETGQRAARSRCGLTGRLWRLPIFALVKSRSGKPVLSVVRICFVLLHAHPIHTRNGRETFHHARAVLRMKNSDYICILSENFREVDLV